MALALRAAMPATFVGVIVGIVAAVYLTRYVKSELYGTVPNQPLTFVASATIMLLVAGSAAIIPSRRAARIEPLIALRDD